MKKPFKSNFNIFGMKQDVILNTLLSKKQTII